MHLSSLAFSHSLGNPVHTFLRVTLSQLSMVLHQQLAVHVYLVLVESQDCITGFLCCALIFSISAAHIIRGNSLPTLFI